MPILLCVGLLLNHTRTLGEIFMGRKLSSSAKKQEGLFLLSLPDCISLSENGGCSLLKLKICQGINCPFMRSKNELKNITRYWEARLSSLDEEKQERISRMYYGGKMPWLGGSED